MIYDNELIFSERQLLIASEVSTNVITVPQSGDGLTLHIVVISESNPVPEEDVPTLAIALEQSQDGEAFEVTSVLNKPAGLRVFGIKLDDVPLQNYMRLSYELGGASPEFTVTAAIVAGGSYE